MTQELALENGLTVDNNGFDEAFKKHQELSRVGAEQKFAGGLADHSEISTKYHTATHLLHATLQRVLGPHAMQRGSNITQERMRFDFAHPEKMTPEQIKQTEDLVNGAIKKNYEVTWAEMPFERAKELGAIGLFEDKYQPIIKVYTVGNPTDKAFADPSSATYSREVCGGPHVEQTGTMGHFKIVKEEAVSAGVRRIKAILE
jgi:alanyl-tRNA synthetase